MCGGTGPPPELVCCACGLSPRVRGNRRLDERPEGGSGSIPACAGEPLPSRRWTTLSRVYPRVCGGTGPVPWWPCRPGGLSPRVRGNRGRRRGRGLASGSIPACAGEPATRPFRAGRPGVYPRVCGGTRRRLPQSPRWRGLSPRVRGNHPRECARYPVQRSIPACAGEPLRPRDWRLCGRVYPRVCGGTTAASTPVIRAQGLSPRVRGNHHLILRPAWRVRSIPACAGEPLLWTHIPAQ